MNALDLVRAFYDYNAWANSHVLDAASRLREEELARDLGASFGSVQGNLVHMLGAQSVWLSRWTGVPALAGPELEDGLAGLTPSYDISHHDLREFVASLSEDGLERVFSYVDTQGVAQERVFWQSLLHVVNHGTHHRSQAAAILKGHGASPVGLDFTEFLNQRPDLST